MRTEQTWKIQRKKGEKGLGDKIRGVRETKEERVKKKEERKRGGEEERRRERNCKKERSKK